MAGKRSLLEVGESSSSSSSIKVNKEEDEDDFTKEALRDQKRYRKEVEEDERARVEAKKANRKYIKDKKKKEKKRPDQEQELFDGFRKSLGLSKSDARTIQLASMVTLGQRIRRGDTSFDIDRPFESSESEEEEEEEEERMLLTHDRSMIKKQDYVIGYMKKEKAIEMNDYFAPCESDSEEELVMLSIPQKKPPSVPQISLSIASVLELSEVEDEEVSSSDEEVINLGFTPVASESSRKRPELITSKAVDTTASSQTALPRQSEPPLPSQAVYVIPDNTCRPTFAISPDQMKIGPLHLDSGVKVPAAINRFLREYQREGIQFFYNSYQKERGALLGDDMGLGKTIQVIAFLSAIMKKEGKESSDFHRRINSIRAGRSRRENVWPTCLIVCPASVIANWQNELDTWGYFEHAMLDEYALKDFERGKLDILLTSHQMAKNRIKQLNELEITIVIVDECHTLKNPNSNLTQSLNSIQCKARFGLTGTAIQNRFEEFWTLLDWSNPGHFGTLKHWQQLIAEPIRKGQLATATMLELAQGRKIAEQLKFCLLPAYFLRRTKALIKAQLPEKRDNIVFCPLSPLQIASYRLILNDPQVQYIKRAKEPCDCGREDDDGLVYQRCKCCYGVDEEGKRWNYHMLKYIMLLQRCSNHLALVFPDSKDNIPLTEDSSITDQMRKSRYLRQVDIVQQLFPYSWETKQNNKLNGFRAEYCGKWLVLRTLMQEWKKKNDKVLLFSLNLRLLDWIAYFVEMEGYKHIRLDGSTPQKKRQPLVDDFNTDPSIFIFLISTTAGGTGLNLTGANKVVVFDPHWNPAHDLQAMDRAYRFGQTRDVDVYRLIGKGSLEETIYDRQIHKQQMGRIGYDASEERRYFDPSDAKGFVRLFELHETGNITRDIIKACDITEATFAMQHLVKEAEVHKVKMEDDSTDMEGLFAPQTEEQKAVEEDPIARVLQMTGIEYTHNNDSLLGGSRVESAMSRKARELMTVEGEKDKALRLPSRPNRRAKVEFPETSIIATWPPKRSTSMPSQS